VADTGLVRRALLPPVKINRSIREYLFNPGYPKNGAQALRFKHLTLELIGFRIGDPTG